jgi:LacI family transcriptional regulator
MPRKRVAMLIETSSSWGSQIIAGIADYVRRHERWMLYLDHRGMYERPTVPPHWPSDGVIARVTTERVAEDLATLGAPVVNVSQIRVPTLAAQQVTTDERRVGELAAETLIGAGARQFGYYGPPVREHYVDNVLAAYSAALQSAGYSCQVTDARGSSPPRPDAALHVGLELLAEWLRGFRRPAAILCWSSVGAHYVSEACAWAKIRVPEDISILSGDHDMLAAEISQPRVTCIDHAPRRVGYVAAAELARMMAGGKAGEPLLIEPDGIIARESVSQVRVEDELVERALAFIAENGGRNISIQDVLDAVPTSRRNLERRFRLSIGRGPATEIRRRRLQHARRLLAETGLSVKQIALQCGFANPEQLQRLVRAETSFTPLQYREAHRRPQAGAPMVPPIDWVDRLPEHKGLARVQT